MSIAEEIREREQKSHKRQYAKHLRKRMTEAEDVLWNALRGRRFHGLKFRRQVAIGPFIADFCCKEKRLILEVDGSVHATRQGYDRERDAYLSDRGYRVIRVSNADVLKNVSVLLAERLPSP
ncbi:MAG: endonuclease domain-containing protein [Candidatus Peregrinibacteria bacterium]|nr:endonuclease domain-containing protein [Candidatus Peregrinibacteria bacterium]